MAVKKKKHQRPPKRKFEFVVRKIVLATSIEEALKKEHNFPVVEITLVGDNQDTFAPMVGFPFTSDGYKTYENNE